MMFLSVAAVAALQYPSNSSTWKTYKIWIIIFVIARFWRGSLRESDRKSQSFKHS